MKYLPNLSVAISYAHSCLANTGVLMKTESWQGIKSPIEMFEALDVLFQCPMPNSKSDLEDQVKPNLPWALHHFRERISGIPHNPPPSSSYWPYADKDNVKHKSNEVFSHTYPERFWPQYAGNNFRGKIIDHGPGVRAIGVNPPIEGIRFGYGDYDDLIDLLLREPHTRQAYLPIWFPEDTGAVEGQRVPCTLGYLIRRHGNYLHITYKIRSCDYLRHFRDDIYMAILLLYDVLYKLQIKDRAKWGQVNPGIFKFQADSLHVFAKEKNLL